MGFAILGLGTAVPPTRLDQAKAEAVAHAVCCRDDVQKQILSVLYRHSGIDSRHVVFSPEIVRDVLDGTTASGSPFLPVGDAARLGPTTRQRMEQYAADAPPLAEAAARQALDDSGVEAADITHLVTVSCTGFRAPGVDVGLIKRLGLSPHVERTHVGFMGCHGALNGLRVARALVAEDPTARVLLCAVELCSLHYYYNWNPKKLVSNAIFADGAAAVVGASSAAVGSGHWVCRASGSRLFPDSEATMTWDVGDHGFDMTLSTRVPNLIAANLRPFLAGWLAKHRLTIEDVASWAVHPGGPRILSDIEKAIGLSEQATADSRDVLREFGNMSSPTVLFALDRLRKRRAPRPCVALGFGPGLVAEAALFD
ncbi:MAG: type III polyketide synthase [Gemmataceae bacterium]